MRYRKNSGEVWGFYTTINTSSNSAKIVSSADSSLSYPVKIVGKEEITDFLKNILSA